MPRVALICLLMRLATACLDASDYESRDTAGADVPGVDTVTQPDVALPDPGSDLAQDVPGTDPGTDSGTDPGAETTPDAIDADATDAEPPPGVPERSCATVFAYKPGYVPASVAVAGVFNAWTEEPMADPDNDGTWTLSKTLAPGLYAYKVVVRATSGAQPEWLLDPANPYRTSDGGVENSGMRVGDCTVPLLTAKGADTTFEAATGGTGGTGSATGRVQFTRAAGGGGPDVATVSVQLVHDFVGSDVSAEAHLDEHGLLTVTSGDLAPGKYAFVVSASDVDGHAAEPARLVFWIEPEAFDWRDTPLYMIMTDRFVDGDPSNNPAPTPGAHPSADFHGGDLQGVAEAIEGGVFDQLGVRALWLSPWVLNPTTSHVGSDGVHSVTGYHGYWPAAPRTVEPRIGGEAALEAVVKAAHAHGMRVMMDYVVNHVYETHPYFVEHPDWFNTGCICGTDGCDWTTHRLDCLFASYMPDVNWFVPAAAEQMVADAVWWLERFELDGLRVDAVKHVPDLAMADISTRVHEVFETGGVEHFLLGETAMGWGGDDVVDSLNDYETISRYLGPWMLNGQFDFVLYHAVSYNTWAYGDKGLIHADYWLQQSLAHYPADAIMTPYLGSHDTPRFLAQATYRGQDAAHPRETPSHQYDDLPLPPTDHEPYGRMQVGLAWLLTIPGLPLVYYGDEYGQQGGHDPDNRRWWKPEDTLDAEEAAQLALVRAIGQARAASPALRRGTYVSLKSTETFLCYARVYDDQVAIVALNHSSNPATESVAVPPAVPLANGLTLTNALATGEQLTVTDGALVLSLPPRSAGVYLP